MPQALARGNRMLVASAARHVVVAGSLLWLFAALLQAILDLSPLYPLKAVLLFGMGVLLLAPLLMSGHPFRAFGAANRITLLRALLTALLGGFLGETISEAVALTMVAGGLLALLFDGVDGYLARRSGLVSEFGARFDMETDAALILLFSLLAWHADKAGAWVVLAGLWRYLFIAAGWVLPWLRAPLPASKRRQTVCVIQIVVMLIALLPMLSSPWSDGLLAAALALLTVSFCIDIKWLAQQRVTCPAAGDQA